MIMKKTPPNKSSQTEADDLLPEYSFDYGQARPNRFASQISQERLIVQIDPDVSEIFSTPEAVNTALRALVAAIPEGLRHISKDGFGVKGENE